MKHKCGICHGSGKTNSVYWAISMVPHPNDSRFEMVDTGKLKDCPGCDGFGVSIIAKIANGDMKALGPFDIDELCKNAIDKFPKEVELVKNGKTRAIGRLVKDVIDASDKRADPREINIKLSKMIEEI